MLLWRHWDIEPTDEKTPKSQRKSYALKAALQEFFPDQGEFKEFDDFQATDEESLKKLLLRNKGDALFTLKLAELFWSKLNKKQRTAALIEARCIPLVANTMVIGINSSKEMAKELSKKLAKDAKDLEVKLLELSPEAVGVNFGSPKQVQKLLYETWGLPCTRLSKTGNPSTDKYALFDLAPLDPRAKMLKELREAKNNRTKYAEAVIKSLDYNGDGCVRPSARIFGTYTSRMTYNSGQTSTTKVEKTTKAKGLHLVNKKVEVPTGIALHQWKRGQDYRRLIQVPEGYTLVELDFAGQEFRWMAVASMDETMLGLCAEGEDAHSYMGAAIAEIDYHDLIDRVRAGDVEAALQRKYGKFSNLSFQYRVSAKTATMKARVDYELEVELWFIKQALATYLQRFPGVPEYWSDAITLSKDTGYAETFAGRRVQIKKDWCGKDKWPNESTAINYPIQGTGGDQKYLALAVARNELNKWGAKFYYELHDGLFFIVPTAKAQAFSDDFKQRLSNLPYKAAWGVTLPISFPVDAVQGPTWGDLR
jgi:DNA polymerase-1